MVKKRGKKKVSKNLLAILLVIAILLSVVGTYMAIYNANVVRVIEIEPASLGKVGVYVNNPELPAGDEGGG